MLTPDKQQLLDLVSKPLENMIATDVKGDIDRERVIQYAIARRNELYYRGKQYIYPVIREGQIVDWGTSPGNMTVGDNQKTDPNRAYDYVLNFIRGDGDKYIAILGQKAPSVKAEPTRKDDATCVRRSRKADSVAGVLHANWDMDYVVPHLALDLWKYGTTFIYTPFIADGEKYGVTEEPNVELRAVPVGEPHFECVNCGAQPSVPEVQASGVCPQCGSPLGPEDYRDAETAQVPEIVGEPTRYANGSVEIHICSLLYVSTNFYIRDLDQAPWLWYEYEEHKGTLMQAYPQLKDIFRNSLAQQSTGETSTAANMGRTTRDIASSPTGVLLPPRKNRWTYSRYWLKPSMYNLIADTTEQGQRTQDELQKQFPRGVKVVVVNDKVVDLEHESLTEVWVACKSRPNDYIYSDAGCEDFIGPQDLINDHHNTMKETADRSNPITLYDPQIIDPAVLNKHRSTPLEFLPVLPNAGGALRDKVWNTPTPQINPQIINWVDGILNSGRQISGILPSIFGGDSGVQKTARQAEMDRNQGLMQLSLPWNQMRRAIARAYENGVMQLAKHSNGRVPLKGSPEMPAQIVEMPDISELLEGGWRFKPEEGIPMTWGQRRDMWWSLLEKDPQVWQLVGLSDPENLVLMQEAMGMADWKVPNLDAWYYVHDTIRELLLGAPVEQAGQIDPMTGIPGPPQLLPSIPVREFEDDHLFCANAVRLWAQTDAAVEHMNTNRGGYENVIAWGKQHFMMAQPPAPVGPDGQSMPMAPSAAPPSGGPEPPPLSGPGPQGAPEAAPPPAQGATPPPAQAISA